MYDQAKALFSTFLEVIPSSVMLFCLHNCKDYFYESTLSSVYRETSGVTSVGSTACLQPECNNVFYSNKRTISVT